MSTMKASQSSHPCHFPCRPLPHLLPCQHISPCKRSLSRFQCKTSTSPFRRLLTEDGTEFNLGANHQISSPGIIPLFVGFCKHSQPLNTYAARISTASKGRRNLRCRLYEAVRLTKRQIEWNRELYLIFTHQHLRPLILEDRKFVRR